MASPAKAALLLALAPKGGAGDKGDKPDEEADDAYGGGARDVLDAIHDNDEKALEMALKTFVMQCMHGGEEESES